MQIRDIVLYSHDGRTRVVPFVVGAVNVITGASKSGKSALIDIVDYCFGADECGVPEGPIRRSVSWFGVRLQLDGGQAFIARRVPQPRAKASEECFLSFANDVAIPSPDELRQTTNTKGLVAELSLRSGIRDNIHDPAPGQTRHSLSANIRHALALCFQPQDEIIRRHQLFHNCDDNWFEQALKDTLPYFLGAVDDDFVRKREEVRKLREQLRGVERKVGEINALRGQGLTKADQLLAQARDQGLSAASPAGWEATVTALRLVAQTTVLDAATSSPDGTEFARLSDERRKLLEEHRRVREEIAAVRSFEKDERGYTSEASEQRARLQSIGIFADSQHTTCPLCTQNLPVSAQPPSVGDITATLTTLASRLDNVTRVAPQLEKAVGGLEDRSRELQDALASNRAQMEAVRSASDQLLRLRDEGAKRAHVLGRISLYLESMPDVPDTQALEREAAELTQKIKALDADLSYQQIKDRIESIVSILSRRMTEWARQLELEHSKFPLRLDLKKLTIVADTDDGPVPMGRMGSGENWVGYHLIAHLALHQWFVERKRPVPHFVFFDQPSQVYFPPEKVVDGTPTNVSDEDRLAVARMFNLIFEATATVAPHLQVVITEHADIDDPRYQTAIAERWRRGVKLVPDDWPRS